MNKLSDEIDRLKAKNARLKGELDNLEKARNEALDILVKEKNDLNTSIRNLNANVTALARFMYQNYRLEIDRSMAGPLSGKPFEAIGNSSSRTDSIVIYECVSFIRESLERWIPPDDIRQIIRIYSGQNNIGTSYDLHGLQLTSAKLIKQLVGSRAWVDQDHIVIKVRSDIDIKFD